MLTLFEQAVLDAVNGILALVLNLLGIANTINSNTKATAQETHPFQIETNTDTIINLLQDATFGLSALDVKLTAIQGTVTALGTPQQAGSPVTLPATTPAGGSWIDQSNIGTEVWNYADVPGDFTAWQLVQESGLDNNFQRNYGLLAKYDWLFWFETFPLVGNTGWVVTYPNDDPTTILAGDTLLSWLTRENPTQTVVHAGGADNYVIVEIPGTPAPWVFVTSMTEADFTLYKAGLFPPAGVVAAPIWPGLANVTLGTPVAISTSFTITADCDGVLVEITGVPSKQGQFAFGDLVSWRNVGALAFTDDNGDAEFPQTLGFTSAVYCPKSMAHASGLVVRASAGVTGTITPWTIG